MVAAGMDEKTHPMLKFDSITGCGKNVICYYL